MDLRPNEAKEVAEVVFNNKSKLRELNKEVHPKVVRKIIEIIKTRNEEYIVVDIPIPVREFMNICDYMFLVVAEEETRINRALKRGNLSKEQIIARIKSQMTNEEYVRYADKIIVNEGSVEDIDIELSEFNNKKIGFYAGCFDPFTNGHLNILKKACTYYDKVILGMGVNEIKTPRVKDKIKMANLIRDVLKENDIKNVEVVTYDNLTVAKAIEVGATELIRGIRSNDEYKREEVLRTYNKSSTKLKEYLKINKQKAIIPCGLPTRFFYPTKGLEDISSTMVMEKYIKRENISNLVPRNILTNIEELCYNQQL